MEGEYFVFEYYTSDDKSKSCLVPFQVVDGRLLEIEAGRYNPQELNASERATRCLNFLRGKKVKRVFTCAGDCMYDEVLGLITHFSGGEGKYAFHYDRISLGNLEEISVENYSGNRLSQEERENKKRELGGLFL